MLNVQISHWRLCQICNALCYNEQLNDFSFYVPSVLFIHLYRFSRCERHCQNKVWGTRTAHVVYLQSHLWQLINHNCQTWHLRVSFIMATFLGDSIQLLLCFKKKNYFAITYNILWFIVMLIWIIYGGLGASFLFPRKGDLKKTSSRSTLQKTTRASLVLYSHTHACRLPAQPEGNIRCGHSFHLQP